MNRLYYSLAAISMAAATMLSCNKSETEFKNDSNNTVKITVSGEIDSEITKTYIEENAGTYLAHWSDVANEHLGLVFDEVVADMAATTLDAFDITADVATFYGSASISLDEHTIHPFYPASAYNKTYDSGKIGLTLNASQHPVTSSFDPATDIMIGADQNITIDDADNVLIENVVFQRPMAVLRLHLIAKNDQAKAYGESVTSVEMTVAEDKTLTGNFSYVPNNSEITWNTKNCSVNAVYDALYNNADQVLIDTDDDYNSVYFVINPETLDEGSSITFNVETDVHSGINKITRTVTVPSGGMTFLAGCVNEINLTIRDKDVPDVVVDNRILVEGFDNVSVSKSQPAATATGVTGTGVSSNLQYTYSTENTNIRFNQNGQSTTNPYLYISGASHYLIMGNIAVSDQTYIDFSAKVKYEATLTLKYKESSSDEWIVAGTYNGTTSFTEASLKFLISNTVQSIDIMLLGSNVMIIDDIVLKPGSAPSALTMSDISVSSRSDQSITFAWTAVDGAVGYKVSSDGGLNYGETQTELTYTLLNLSSYTDNTIYVKAIGDGLTNLDSEPKSLTAKTNLSVPSGITWTKNTKTVSWTDTNTSAGDYGTVYKYQYTINNGASFTDIASPGTSVTLDISETKTVKLIAVCISDANLNSSLSDGTVCEIGDTKYYTKVTSIESGANYLLVSQYGENSYILNPVVTSNALPMVSANGLIADNKIVSNAANDIYAVTIKELDALYSISYKNGSNTRYLYVATSGKNEGKNLVESEMPSSTWDFELHSDDNSWIISNQYDEKSQSRAIFIGNSGNSCKYYSRSNFGNANYANTYVHLYKLEE